MLLRQVLFATLWRFIANASGQEMISAAQSRMARAALNWGVRDVALAAGVSTNTITRLERGEELLPRTVDAIRTALETAGVIFIDQNGNGPGVRLRDRDEA